MEARHLESALEAVAALKEPLRRELYRLVVARSRPVSRDEAAAAAGIPRSVAAFHLDRLAKAGLLEVEFRRLSGRRGPGAGRPAKLYRRANREVAVCLPERRYDLAGRLLARAVSESVERGLPVARSLRRAALELGRALGEGLPRPTRVGRRPSTARLSRVAAALDECGFEPRRDGADLVLGNCPFRALAEEYPDLVCGMNRDFIQGVIAGLGATGVSAVLDPRPGVCCVRVRAA